MKRTLLTLTMLAASGLAACAGIFGFDRLEEGAAATEAGVDGNVPVTDGGSDAADARVIVTVEAGCDKVGLPDPPAAGAANELPTIWMAFDTFDLGIQAADGGVRNIAGLNLDSQCTTSLDTSSCIPLAPESPPIDRASPPGADNVGSDLLSIVGSSSPFAPEALMASLRQGKFGAVIALDFYNGEADDPSVKVNFYPALAVNNHGTPTFTQTDRWITDHKYDKGGSTSDFHAVGYVSNNRLVIKLDGSSLGAVNGVEFYAPLQGSKLSLHLTNVLLTATIGKDSGGNYRLTDGVVAGRWATSEMLAGLGGLDDTDGHGVCDPQEGGTDYSGIVKTAVCQGADLATNVSDDVNAQAAADGKQKVACDAISVGARFTTYHVLDKADYEDRVTGNEHTCDAGFTKCR